MWFCLFSCVAVLVEHRLVTDSDRQTQDRSIYRASIASRGNKNRVVICIVICLVQNLCMVWPMPLPSQIPASLASLNPQCLLFIQDDCTLPEKDLLNRCLYAYRDIPAVFNPLVCCFLGDQKTQDRWLLCLNNCIVCPKARRKRTLAATRVVAAPW